MAWDYFLILLLPIGIGSISTYMLIPIGKNIGLVDYPDHRKLHGMPIITTGGLSIFLTFLICSLILLPKGQQVLIYFTCSSMLIILGLLDDREDIPAIQRLVAQAVIALLMCTHGSIFIAELGDLLGIGNIYLGLWGYLVTILAVIGAINAFNMIDGIDGLLGSTAVIVFLSLSVLFAMGSDVNNLKFSLLIALSIIPYLWVNLQIRPVWIQKIFMGDTGSMLIGFSVVWLLIQGSQGEVRSFSVVTALWLICFPLMDMARVMLARKLKGKSVLGADRTHLHHLLSDGRNQKYALSIINSFSVIAVVTGILLELFEVPDVINLLIFILAFGCYVYSVERLLSPDSDNDRVTQ